MPPSRAVPDPSPVDARRGAHAPTAGLPRAAGSDAERDADARALASSLRVRILRICLDEPRTNKEIAQALGKNPATTLHHVRTLVARGFLAAQPARTGARGAREVPYLATGKSWTADLGPGGHRVLLDAFLEELSAADPARVDMGRLGLRLDAEGRDELSRRLNEVLEDFRQREPAADGEPWSVFIAIHHDASREPR
ncbi:winged helix-turn-helix transcriptional regulator [Oerskovia sp. Sa1BUA8]|uniref:Winged helix-turn-helix transcriptional regulator n=1 Tax=Oerskovia douganii TaxID=2762210 RepID=A0A9D5U7U0_9CELL|nr:winged helix-turn-helix domain-containing protein [Oerskovia douganii]MBE7699485.1 winged helix-turn-helix transcriptional regulator [Oerskovia douganii]